MIELAIIYFKLKYSSKYGMKLEGFDSVLDEVLRVLSHESVLHDIIFLKLTISLRLDKCSIRVLLDGLVALLLKCVVVNQVVDRGLAVDGILSILLARSESSLHVFLVHVLE